MVLGLALGIVAWLVTAQTQYGTLTVDTTGSDNPLLAGNLVSIGVPTVITVIWSLVKPDNYTFTETRAINAPDAQEEDENIPKDTKELSETPSWDEKGALPISDTPKAAPAATIEHQLAKDGGHAEKGTQLYNAADADDEHVHVRRAGLDPAELQATVRSATRVALPLTFVLIIFVPCMAIIPRTFSPAGLGAWVGICIAWMFVSAGIVIALPVWESRQALGAIFRGIFLDITGKGGKHTAS